MTNDEMPDVEDRPQRDGSETWRYKTAIGFLLSPCLKHKRLLLACVILTMSYGMLSLRDGTPDFHSQGLLFFEHGWPMKYLEREQPQTTWGSRWRMFSEVQRFESVPFALNLLFAMTLSFLATYLWHFHWVKSKSWRRFSLKELMLVVSALCVGLGSYAKLRQDYRNEKNYLKELEEFDCFRNGVGGVGYIPWYLQPLRDVGIVNEEDWLPMLITWDSGRSRSEPDVNQILADQVAAGRKLSFVDAVDIGDPQLNDQGLKLLCEWVPSCRFLMLSNGSMMITDKGIAYLADNLGDLRELYLHRMTSVSPEIIRQIAAIKSLEVLGIDVPKTLTVLGTDSPNAFISTESLKLLSTLPNLRILSIPYYEILEDSVEDGMKEDFRQRGIQLHFN